ncbi:Bug family tripartite tricarboxylate transporter substrate binding protein [Hydrogenophaga sp. OTU3427]|uniref:Bug family tripartite tricarboxylate transporter substrate binding protein n=1 Tax=Hydrogenophaga sp. OTU3427 TaxID=3043856 RepID=UPI00313E20F6
MRTFSFSASRRTTLVKLLGVAFAGTAGRQAFAQAGGPLRFIIASTPGTGPDTMARLLQPQLQARWQRPVVVENKAGAGGVIGIDAVAKATPDGTTLMLQTSTMFLLPHFYKQIPFDPLKNFQPITQVGWSTFALVVNNDVPAKNIQELVAWLKEMNGRVSYGSPGKGTENHLFAELFRQQTGVEMTHVPYRGAANAIQDLIGGQVSLMFLPIATAHVHAKTGRIRILACTSKERFPLMKDIPSLHEQGVTGFDYSVWYGVYAPAGLAPELVNKYREDLHAVLNSREIVAKFAEQGWSVKTGSTPELDALGKMQSAKWREVIAQTKVETE